MIYNGSTKIIKIGNNNAAYDTTKRVYQYYRPAEQETDWSQEYLTFLALEDGTFKFSGNSVSYSVDGGSTWASLASNTDSPTIQAGNKIMFKAELEPSPLLSSGIGSFYSTGRFDAMGNPYSLLYGDNFRNVTDLTGKDFALYSLLIGTRVVSAKNLSLPATTLSSDCYAYMFSGCTSLAEAPELPATTLARNCYNTMFRHCSSLTTAPELPAATLVTQCYYNMFNGCTSLNYIKMLATDAYAVNCLSYWVFYVASTGTFVKHPNANLESGVNGIPAGWTVQTATE